VIIVLCTGHLLKLLRVCKVTLVAKAHGNFVEAIGFHIASDQSRVQGIILMRDLLVQLLNTRREMESLKVADTMLQIWIRSISLWRVFSGTWRRASREIDVSTGEPSQFSSIMEVPLLSISLIGDHDLLSSHFRQIVVGCTSSIQISAHSFKQLFITGCIFDVPWSLLHWTCATLTGSVVSDCSIMG